MVRIIKPADQNTTDVSLGEDVDRIEYGIQLPNGAIWWRWEQQQLVLPRSLQAANLQQKQVQEAAQKGYKAVVERAGVAYDPEVHKLTFVQRTEQIRFTEPVPLEGEDLQEYGAVA